MKTWIKDDNGNRASVERWGSEEKALESLATIENCYGCTDCTRCYGCTHCTRCVGCADCYGCTRCSRCTGCLGCYGCTRCTRCTGCVGCADCTDCTRCSDQTGDRGGFVVPVIADIHAKVYAAASEPGALEMGRVHTCETTHCRAGHVVHLAGDAGYALEKKTSPLFAAMQIYKASGYEISPVRFFDSNEDALADMQRLAEASSQDQECGEPG